MPRASVHSLERSINAMTVGLVVEREAIEKREAPLRLDETDQVFQVAIEGVAGPVIEEWGQIEVTFDYTFVYAPNQRSVPFVSPQFTWGFELLSRVPVVVNCALAGWAREEVDPMVSVAVSTTGARVLVGAFIPGHEDDPVKFKGLLHLTFGGFAAPSDLADEEVF